MDLISYDESQLGWLPDDDMLRKGSDLSKVYGDSGYVLAIWDKDVPLDVGDKIQLGGFEVEIAGMLKYSPFSNSGRTDGEIILICSRKPLRGVTGMRDYAIIDIQVAKSAADQDVAAIRDLVNGRYEFDRQAGRGRPKHLLGIQPVYLRVPGSHRPDYRVQYRQQHFHERVRKDEAIWRHAGGGDGRATVDRDDSGGSGYLCVFRLYHRLRGRAVAEQAAV